MNQAENLYTFRTPYPDLLALARAQVVSMPVWRNATLIEPTIAGSSFTLLDPAGNTLIDARAITKPGNVSTCALTAADFPAATAMLGEGYQEIWTLVLADGTTRTVDREAALARRPLTPVITDDDLLEDYPGLNVYLGNLTSWQRFIDGGWKRIIGLLISQGHLPYLIKSGWSFREAHRQAAYAKLFGHLALSKTTGNVNFAEARDLHRKSFLDEWSHINFKTDDNHDGRVDDESVRRSEGDDILTPNAPVTRYPAAVRDDRW